MKYHLEHFSEIMDKEWCEETEEIAAQSDLLYGKLTADLTCDVSSPQIQEIVYGILQFIQKHGAGASDYIVGAFRYYAENNALSEK